jgi:hypothetical protein
VVGVVDLLDGFSSSSSSFLSIHFILLLPKFFFFSSLLSNIKDSHGILSQEFLVIEKRSFEDNVAGQDIRREHLRGRSRIDCLLPGIARTGHHESKGEKPF